MLHKAHSSTHSRTTPKWGWRTPGTLGDPWRWQHIWELIAVSSCDHWLDRMIYSTFFFFFFFNLTINTFGKGIKRKQCWGSLIWHVMKRLSVASWICLGYEKLRSPRWSLSGPGAGGTFWTLRNKSWSARRSGWWECMTTRRAAALTGDGFSVSDQVRPLHLSSNNSLLRPLGCGGCVAGKFESAPLEVFPAHAAAQKTVWRSYSKKEWQRSSASHLWCFTFLSGFTAKVALRVSSCGRWAHSGPRLGHRLDFNATERDVKWSRRVTEAGRT